jgi:hypothetical protein
MEIVNMKKKIMLPVLTTLLLVGTFIPAVFADYPVDNVTYDQTGHYSIVSAGVGLYPGTSGSIVNFNIPGTVQVAYLYWAGIDDVGAGDDSISFGITPTLTAITADVTLAAEWGYTPTGFTQGYTYVYREDVTSLVSTGTNTYDISGVEIWENYGAGLVVVYEDPGLPMNRVVLMDGADGFWFDWGDPLGPNSEVAIFEFDSDTGDRDADLFLFSAGTEHDDRPNEIWTSTGSGAIPTDIVGTGDATGLTYPLYASDGPCWDTYTDTIEVTSTDEWLAVQIESIAQYAEPGAIDYAGQGTSGVFLATGIVLPIPEPVQGGKVTGGGQCVVGQHKKIPSASFGFNAMWFEGKQILKGEINYVDHTTGQHVHVHELTYLTVWEDNPGNKPWPKQKAIFGGYDVYTGKMVDVYVEDNGEPGKNDKFLIFVDGNYLGGSGNYFGSTFTEDTLLAGNIQTHKPPK